MKKTIITTSLILGCLLLINTTGVMAAAPAGTNKTIRNKAKETVIREVTRNIICPDFITENSPLNEVKAIVQVNQQGIIGVQEINSGNTELKEYVLNQLKNTTIKNNALCNEKFVLDIIFKVD